MILDDIKNFNKQFEYDPEVINNGNLKSAPFFVVGGMGGSTLAPDLFQVYDPAFNIRIHRDYGFPSFFEKYLDSCLFIAASHSGNTEETLDFAKEAKNRNANLACITTGGGLLEFAKANKVPYVQMPAIGMQPRMALGYAMLGLSRLMGQDKIVKELKVLTGLNPSDLELQGQAIAKKLEGKIPLIYASGKNQALARLWKIKLNETAKVPAFYNIFPELNHNEMTGFDGAGKAREFNGQFCVVQIRDSNDNPQIQKRMDVSSQIYASRDIQTDTFELAGHSQLEKMFNCILLADWTSYYLSQAYGVDPEAVALVEEFKKLI